MEGQSGDNLPGVWNGNTSLTGSNLIHILETNFCVKIPRHKEDNIISNALPFIETWALQNKA